MNVIKLIRSRRFFHLALKHLLEPPIRKKLKKMSQYKEVKIEPPGKSILMGQELKATSHIADQTNDLTAGTIHEVDDFALETFGNKK